MEDEEGGVGKAGGWRARALRLARRRLPILRWARDYDRTTAIADLVAGVTLGLTLVPQSIAYAALADRPVQHGLYTAIAGTIVYVFLGTVKEVSIGPTSLMALLTLQTCHGLPIEYMVLLTFLSGCVVLAMGLLRLGFLVDLISPGVTSAFTSATAVLIVVSQVKGMLGLSFTAESLVDNVRLLASNAGKSRLPDALLGLACCVVLLLLRKVKDLPLSPKRRRLRKALWLLSISRNALVVLAASALAVHTQDVAHPDDPHPLFKLSGRVEPGLPRFAWPPFSVPGEGAEGVVGFTAMASRLGVALLLLPLVMVLANIAIAKAFSKGRVDATQEMLTLGLCNVVGATLGAMPACGAFTRSAVSHSSGVRTPAAGLYSGMITVLALAFMTQHFYFIPRACLSAVLICAVMFMVDIGTLRRLATSGAAGRSEAWPALAALLVALAASVELALLAGSAASLAAMLAKLMRPPLQTQPHPIPATLGGGSALVASVGLCWAYVNAEHVAARLAARQRDLGPRALLIDCQKLSYIDYAAMQELTRMSSTSRASGCPLGVFGAGGDVARQLERGAAAGGWPAPAVRTADVAEALHCLFSDSAAAAAAAGPADPTDVPLLEKPATTQP